MRAFLLLIGFVTTVCYAQNTDSLIRLIRPAAFDTGQVRLLNGIAHAFMETDAEKGLSYANEAIFRAGKIDDKTGLSNASNIKGVCYDVIGNYDSALFYYKQALSSSPLRSDAPSRAGVYSNIGLVYWNLDRYPEALAYFHKAGNLVKKSGNTHFLAVILNNTGLIYHDIKDYTKSNVYFKRAISVYQNDKDTLESIGSVMNLAINYFETKRYAECEALFREYTAYINRLDDYARSEFLVNKATLEINTTLRANTEKDLEESLRLKKKIGHSLGVANVLIQFSEYYHLKGDFQKSNRYCYEALVLTEELKSLKKLGSVYDNLFVNYSLLHQKDSARRYRELYTAVIDTMFAEARAKAISREQVAFKTFEKEKENLTLVNENNSIRMKSRLILFSAVFGICLLAMIFWFYSRIRKQKAIVKQKEMVDQLIFETEQSERERIARDLHDSVGQKLAVVKMKLSMNNSDTGLLDQAIADVRTASHNLMPEDLKKGLIPAIEEMADKINFTEPGTRIQLTVKEELRTLVLPKQTALYLYRIVQEIIHNAMKYAEARTIYIHVDLEKQHLGLVLSDDGIGLPEEPGKEEGMGLKNISARIQQLKGSLQIVSLPRKGTRFTIHVPL